MQFHGIHNGRTSISNRFIQTTCAILCCLFLAACSEQPTSSLKIGTNNWIGYQPFYIARERGYYNTQTIKLVELNNTTDVMHALRSKQLDAAALTLDEVLTIQQQGVDMRVVLVVDISDGGDVLLAKPEFDSIEQLASGKVAVEYTAVGATMLDAALSSAEMDINDIEIVSCGWDKHIECYQTADAVVTFEPVKTELLKQGARVLFDSSLIKGRIIDVLAIRSEAIESKQKQVTDLIEAYYKALDYLKNEQVKAIEIIQARTKMSAAEVVTSLDGIDIPGRQGNLLLFQPGKLENNVEQLVELMLNNGLLQKSVAVETLFDSRFL